MKKQTKRWLAAVLSVMLFAISLYTDAGIMAQAANTKATTATEVFIANLPEGNVLTLNEENNYGRYDFDATKISGVLYWEVKKGTTTGVQSSYTGKVYPVKAGEFEIRVLAFRTRANRTKWLDARKANGYVADPKAEKYVKAASDWVKITVKGEEGLAVAGTQSRLNKLLKDKKVKNIVLFTSAERNFTIGNKNYKGKTLTVNAPNADVDNQGRFVAINVKQIKDSTFRERAKGNRFHITAPNARIIVEKGARVGTVAFQPDMKKDPDAKLNLEVNGTVSGLTIAPVNHEKGAKPAAVAVNTAKNANVSSVKVEEAAALEVKGESTSKTKVTVEEKAEGTVINAESPIQAELKASVELKLDKGAAASVLTLLKAITAIISGGENGSAEDITVKVEKEAEGAKLETAAKVEIKTEVKVEITLGEGAEGSSIVADSEVAKEIKVENQTKEDVEIKDETGEVTTTVGSGSDVQVTPVPTTAPSTGTTTPGTGTINPPSTATPTPTPEDPSGIKVGKMTYTLDGKEEEKEVILKVNEDSNIRADYIADITVPQGTRIVRLKIEAKEPYNSAMNHQYFGFNSETGELLGIEKNAGYKRAIRVFQKGIFDFDSSIYIIVNIKAGEDEASPSEIHPKLGTLDSIYYYESGEPVYLTPKKTEKDFIYEVEVPAAKRWNVFVKGTPYGSWDSEDQPEGKIILYPPTPDYTVLVVNIFPKVGQLGKVQYTIGSNLTPTALEIEDFELRDVYEAGIVNSVYRYRGTVSKAVETATDTVNFTVTAEGYTSNSVSVGVGDEEAVIKMTPIDEKKNVEFIVKIPVSITVKENQELVATIAANPNIVTGSAITLTGSAVTSAPNVKDIVDVTVSNNMATVKFKGNYSKENFETGTVKITFTATAKKGTEILDNNKVMYTWKKGNESLSNKTDAICEVEVDLTQLEKESGLTFSVSATEKSSTIQ